MASTQVTISNTDEPSVPLIVVSLQHVLKLTSLNYISWHSQMRSTLVGYGLFHYVDGNLVVPPPTITSPATETAAAVTTINPAYRTYICQDQLIYGSFSGTLSPSLAPLISRCPSSRTAWLVLAKIYDNPSKGHIKQVRERLRHITKGSKSITEFMCEMKTCADQLTSLGKAIDEEDLVEKVIEQLHDSDYDAVTNGIMIRESTISFDELNEKLVNREAYILEHRQQLPVSLPMTANYVHKQTHKKPHPIQYQPAPAPTKQYNGKCQWCRQPGHFVTNCPLFRQEFPNASPPAAHPQMNPSNRSTTSRYQPNVPRNQFQQPNYFVPKAYSAFGPNPDSTGWLIDSGASHHVTNDLENLSFHGPYGGSDELIIGDGSGLRLQILDLHTETILFQGRSN